MDELLQSLRKEATSGVEGVELETKVFDVSVSRDIKIKYKQAPFQLASDKIRMASYPANILYPLFRKRFERNPYSDFARTSKTVQTTS